MRFISDDANDLKPAWMSSQETECPEKLLPGFWKHYTIADCRFFLWQMLSASISTENQDADASPGEQISFFENLVVYLEASSIVDNRGPLSKAKRGESEQYETGESSMDIKPGEKPPKGDNPHRKLHKRLKRLSIWHRDGFDDPYVILDSFFDAYDLPSFKARLYDILQVCCQEKYYDKGCPADVLYFLEKVESIINAAYSILISEEAKWLDKSKTAMECIASSNGEPECEIEPPAVIIQCLKEFFEYRSLKKWKQELNRICLYSLSSQSAQEWGVWIDSLTLYKLICSLAETAFDLRKNRSALP
ncbi:hypothetical protein MUK70_06485 [Dyadobacter chenwenxiniae]|uniref:Uncharacterized protein n=1 Tax=Dyadobacter chenwenxiniae TaxID=2906456 RepID=A0A9X1TI32_9BACT|nr:hypothetical protein [Dyadobacter chenwenxiniae]MCF0065094.1 hypothetical protein [Dyadobacter chenwenxiniae]UON84634.1 hypothetical protein MUK70_06485 [Dyadobacter chenwenxiniae]